MTAQGRRVSLPLSLAIALALAACSSPGDANPSMSESTRGMATASASPSVGATEDSSDPGVGAPDASPFYDSPGQADLAYRRAVAEGRATDAGLLKLIADQPQAVWLGEWSGAAAAAKLAGDVASAAQEAGRIPVFVVYAIPGRDCGLYSAGGLPAEKYLAFVQGIADAIAGSGAWVILEPDALSQLGDCDGQGDRAGLLREAARVLDEQGADVYLDAGNSHWRTVEDISSRILLIGTADLAGFATNTSNYHSTADERAWGDQVSARVGLPYVTDTSRNGNGSNGEWCNPRGRALGDPPALITGGSMIAKLWVKAPGESDGSCNGGPPAGQWWEEVALELARNA